MTTFNDREQAFEAKFAHDQERAFQARARCNKHLGLWAAKILGHQSISAERHATHLVVADLHSASSSGIVEKVATDLAAQGRNDIKVEDVQEKMASLLSLSSAAPLQKA